MSQVNDDVPLLFAADCRVDGLSLEGGSRRLAREFGLIARINDDDSVTVYQKIHDRVRRKKHRAGTAQAKAVRDTYHANPGRTWKRPEQ